MISNKKTITSAVYGIAVLTMLSMANVNAATYTYTEGNRPEVVGSDEVHIDAPESADGNYLLEKVGFNESYDEYETLNLHGKIGGKDDNYKFKAKSAFRIDFIFGGYDYLDGDGNTQTASKSGFIRENTGEDNKAKFTLTSIETGASTESFFTTNKKKGDSNIFSSKRTSRW